MFDNKIFLAPMAGYTSYPHRLMCAREGADICFTEMVSAKALCYGDKKTKDIARIYENEAPCIVQIFGHEPEIISRAAEILTQGDFTGVKPYTLDINMGCPVRKVAMSGDGSALMRDVKLASEIVKAAVSASAVPVTVKIRSGWDDSSRNCAEIARAAEAAGAQCIFIHGRTKTQMYHGEVSLSDIAAVVKSVKIPVVGNGDISSYEDAVKMKEQTGCSSVMIGRASIGNPDIFSEIKSCTKRERTPAERLSQGLGFLELMVATKGEKVGVNESRPHLSRFIKGLPSAAILRDRLNNAKTSDEMKEWLK
jgi:tRNA-dihydrouridine synthase B